MDGALADRMRSLASPPAAAASPGAAVILTGTGRRGVLSQGDRCSLCRGFGALIDVPPHPRDPIGLQAVPVSRHRWDLPVLSYHKIMVIYPYPFLVVITQLFSWIIFINDCIRILTGAP